MKRAALLYLVLAALALSVGRGGRSAATQGGAGGRARARALRRLSQPQHGLGRDRPAHQVGHQDRHEREVVRRPRDRRATRARWWPTARSSWARTTRASAIPRSRATRACCWPFAPATASSCGRWSHDKLASGRVNDWPQQGVCSTPVRRRQARSTTRRTRPRSSASPPTASRPARTRASPTRSTRTPATAT